MLNNTGVTTAKKSALPLLLGTRVWRRATLTRTAGHESWHG